MTSIGLVLGAGGLVGQAYHSGVLAALDTDLGWDPRGAALVVGTSAGSLSAAALRLDTPLLDLAGWTLGRQARPGLLAHLDAVRAELPPLSARPMTGPWKLPGPRTVIGAVVRPGRFRPMPLLGSMLPASTASLAGLRDDSPAALAQGWPEALWVCATRREDGRRVVFGQEGSPRASLADAVAASCAVPAYLAPVTIEGTDYLDGGLYSPTNADLLVGAGLDLAIIVSPLSGSSWGLDRGMRLWAGRRLGQEVRAIKAAGTEVVCFEPSRATTRVLGLNPMARDRSDRVLRAAYFDTGRQIADPAVRRLLAPLGRRRGPGAPAPGGSGRLRLETPAR